MACGTEGGCVSLFINDKTEDINQNDRSNVLLKGKANPIPNSNYLLDIYISRCSPEARSLHRAAGVGQPPDPRVQEESVRPARARPGPRVL